MTRREIAVRWGEARAKVNLGLAVTGRRDDGYHTLDSIFLRLALHDHLEVRLAAEKDGPDELEVIGGTGVPAADDLVMHAAARLREAVERPMPALRFRLEKDIPVAAGLGGGSADAAAALALAAEAWGITLDEARHARLAARLGADVPFLASRASAARVGGIGELVTPLPAPAPALGVLLVTPPAALSTAAVFAELDRRSPSDRPGTAASNTAVAKVAAALAARAGAAAVAGLGGDLREANDLWPAASALLRALGPLRDALEASLDRPFLLTGSGPTLLALYPSPQEAAQAASRLSAALPREARGARIIATSSSAPGETP